MSIEYPAPVPLGIGEASWEGAEAPSSGNLGDPIPGDLGPSAGSGTAKQRFDPLGHLVTDEILRVIAARLGDLVTQSATPLQLVQVSAGTAPTTASPTYTTYHQKLRLVNLVLTATAAAVITLTIGGETFLFPFAAANTVTFPFPKIIGRGIDITIATTAGTVVAFLSAQTE